MTIDKKRGNIINRGIVVGLFEDIKLGLEQAIEYEKGNFEPKKEDIMEKINKNYDFFKNNFESIVKGHIGKYVVIKDCAVFGYYKTMAMAIEDMENKGYSLGNYIVQECVKNIADNMAIYHSKVLIKV